MNRSDEVMALMKRRRADALVVCGEANLRSLLGFSCDNGILVVNRVGGRSAGSPFVVGTSFFTDFRYAPEARRKCRGMRVADLRRFRLSGGRIGYEGFVPHTRFLQFERLAPKARFVDVAADLLAIRAVKTPEEIAKLRAAEKLDCDIYEDAVRRFRPGMTERQMAAVIRKLMIERGDGEAFETIVCVGKNAAECHHVPDDTVWNGRDPVLVDMGVKLDGYCSDLTRNILPKRMSPTYRRVFELVKAAHDAAIAAAKPGVGGWELDKVARDVIRKGGFGSCFGHSLGHGVGLEIHEAPCASRRPGRVNGRGAVGGRRDWILKPGMLVTIEPGIYLEGDLGVRIEDLILITEDGCEVLSR